MVAAIRFSLVRRLTVFGAMVVAAQMADYLYAPTSNLLILYLLGQSYVATYTPAVQIDGGALLLVNALASVLLPRTALAHAAGEPHVVRRYYIRGTLATFLLLLFAAPILWLLAPYFFRIWLGDPMQATCALLPFVLIHTTIGGSSAVGRSILLAIGKVRAFTISVLIAGIANVFLSFSFVRYFHLGLRGIVLGTICAVAARCGIWLPWYTLRVLNREIELDESPILETVAAGGIFPEALNPPPFSPPPVLRGRVREGVSANTPAFAKNLRDPRSAELQYGHHHPSA